MRDDGDDGDGGGGDDDVMVLVMVTVTMTSITMIVRSTGRRRKLEEYGGVRRALGPSWGLDNLDIHVHFVWRRFLPSRGNLGAILGCCSSQGFPKHEAVLGHSWALLGPGQFGHPCPFCLEMVFALSGQSWCHPGLLLFPRVPEALRPSWGTLGLSWGPDNLDIDVHFVRRRSLPSRGNLGAILGCCFSQGPPRPWGSFVAPWASWGSDNLDIHVHFVRRRFCPLGAILGPSWAAAFP